jgi:hypothetical protein
VRAGIGYRRAHREALLAGDGPELLEVIPGHFFADPEAIAPLAEKYPLVLHEVGMSIGTVKDDLSRATLQRVKALVQIARPLLFSDHLAMTRANGIDLGHLCPVPYTHGMLDLVCDRVRAWQDLLGVPIAIENIAAPFELPADMSEPEFFARLVERTGCGMLLDVTNLVVNGRNHGFDPQARADQYPLEAVWQVHLAGGYVSKDFWIDSHSEPVDEASFALLRGIAGRARDLRAIVVERDDKIPPLAELVAEARRARAVWEER